MTQGSNNVQNSGWINVNYFASIEENKNLYCNKIINVHTSPFSLTMQWLL